MSGLTGTGLVLRNNGANLAVTGNAFSVTGVPGGTAYAITVATQPSAPAQICTVTNGSGTVGSSNVTNISVTCVTTPLTLSSSTPANNATVVSRTQQINLTFSAALNSGTAASSIQLQETANGNPRGSGSALPVTLNVTGSNVDLIPRLWLKPLTSYTVTASTALRGTNGEQLGAAASTTFTTRDGAWQQPTQIENTADNAIYPQIAMVNSRFSTTEGVGFAVWTQSDGTNARIYASRYALGSGWSPPVLISNGNGTAVLAPIPQVAVDQDGNAVAVWRQSDGAGYSIWANRYTFGGGGWGTPVRISNGTGRASDPRVIASSFSTSYAVAVWAQSEGTRSDIWANRLTTVPGQPGVLSWDTPRLIETDDAGDALNPQIAYADGDTALAVWEQSNGTQTDIHVNRYSVVSGWDLTPTEINVGGNTYNPQIAIDQNGNALAVWDQSDGTRNNIWANRYTVGSNWGTAVLIEADAGNASVPQIAFDPFGDALAVWQQSDGQGSHILSNRYTNTSGNWGTPVPIAVGPGEVRNPQIVIDPADAGGRNLPGNALVVWESFENTRWIIRANRYIWANYYFQMLGNGWVTPEVLNDTNVAGNASDPQIAIDRSGNALAVWSQSDGTAGNIWASRFE